MKILGLDPGKTTGWALIKLEDKKIVPLGFGHDKDMTMKGQIEHIQSVDLVVIEDFLIDPKYAETGKLNYDPMPASQVIGSVKTLCSVYETEYRMQSRSIKPVAYGFVGKQYVKGKANMHKWDALAHAVYYAVKKLGAKPVGLP